MSFIKRTALAARQRQDLGSVASATRKYRIILILATCILVIIAVAIRILNLHFLTRDGAILSEWFVYLYDHGFNGLATIQSNYGMPYLTILWLSTHLGFGPITSVKLITYSFEGLFVLLLFFVYRDRGTSFQVSSLLAVCTLFIPTLLLNSSVWGQTDIIYVSLCFASWWASSKQRPVVAWLFFGLAVAFKPQAIFFLPFLVLWYFRNNWIEVNQSGRRAVDILSPLAAILVFFTCQTPGLLAGRSLSSTLSSYFDVFHPDTANKDTVYGGGVANIWQIVGRGDGPAQAIAFSVVLFTFALVLLIMVVSLFRVRPNTIEATTFLPITILILIPYLLPYMHERYFMGAEVFSVTCALITRSRVLGATAVLLQFTSFPGYAEYLFQPNTSTLPVTPALMSIVNGFLLLGLIVRLFRKEDTNHSNYQSS